MNNIWPGRNHTLVLSIRASIFPGAGERESRERHVKQLRGYVLHTKGFGLGRGAPRSLDNDHRGVVIVGAAIRSRNGGGTDAGIGCPERGQSVFARRVNLPNIMEIYSRGIRRRNGFPRARSRLLCNSLATLAPRFPSLFLRSVPSVGAFRRHRVRQGERRGSEGSFKLNNVRCARRLKR